eukprot:gene3813-2699_t
MSLAKRSLNVGVVGMGNMGIPIARNLAFKARSAMYLQLHSRSFNKVRQVSEAISTDGATCAMRLHNRYSTMTKWCDVMILALANRDAAAHALLEDEEALLPNARPGQIIVDHTTVDMDFSRHCAEVAEQRGAFFLDAPMSGSPRAVFNNQLVLMVGGPAEYYQRLLPIFRLYADHIHHMGESGSGTATKLVSQALVASHNAAAAEAMTMANRLGIEDHRALVKVLDASWGSSTMLRRNAGAMQDAIRSPDKVPPTSHLSVDHLLGDLELLDDSLPPPPPIAGSSSLEDVVDEDGRERFPVLDASLRMLGAARETGMGSRDLSTVVHFIHAAAEMERQQYAKKHALLRGVHEESCSSRRTAGGGIAAGEGDAVSGEAALLHGVLSADAFMDVPHDRDGDGEAGKAHGADSAAQGQREEAGVDPPPGY